MQNDCVLCNSNAENVIYNSVLFRIVLVTDEYYPGYLRLILNQHVKEITDLSIEDARVVFDALYKIESIVRQIYQPDKMNLASLGNVVPHLHWHIIPRYKNDRHFPNPIWGEVTSLAYRPDSSVTRLTISLQSQIAIAFA